MNRRTLAKTLLAATVTSVAFPGTLRAWTPTPPGQVRYADISGIALALSPDGTKIAGLIDREVLAIWDATSFEIVVESAPMLEIGLLDQTSLTWSPGSDAIAFSIDATRELRDSDIYLFDVASASLHNLTDEASSNEAAVSLRRPLDIVLDIDMYPNWSPDGDELLFTRYPWGIDSPRETRLMRISREGGEATEIALMSETHNNLVNGPVVALEDGSVLYGTWPREPDDPDHGVFLVTPDGRVEGVSTGMLTSGSANMQLMHVAGNARKASVISHQNYASFDRTIPMWFELDLDTGIPTPYQEILSLPTGNEAWEQGLLLLAAPAFLTDNGIITGYVYATADGPSDMFTLWRHDVARGDAVALGTVENPGPREAGITRLPSVDVTTAGTVALVAGGNLWLAPIDA